MSTHFSGHKHRLGFINGIMFVQSLQRETPCVTSFRNKRRKRNKNSTATWLLWLVVGEDVRRYRHHEIIAIQREVSLPAMAGEIIERSKSRKITRLSLKESLGWRVLLGRLARDPKSASALSPEILYG